MKKGGKDKEQSTHASMSKQQMLEMQYAARSQSGITPVIGMVLLAMVIYSIIVMII